MIATSSAPVTAHHDHAGHGHDHHRDDGHAHRHDHGHAHGASAGAAQAGSGVTLGPSFLRASLGARLALAGGLAVLIWILVFWARMPIAGGAS